MNDREWRCTCCGWRGDIVRISCPGPTGIALCLECDAPLRTRLDELKEEFLKFDEECPRVWQYFQMFTFDRIYRGFKRFSAYAVIERIRWETELPDTEGEFKISNNHRPFYARAFMEAFPQHVGFFQLNEQISRLHPPHHWYDIDEELLK